MKKLRAVLAPLAAVALVLAGADAAFANGFTADSALSELGGIGRLCLGMVFLAFLLVGGYTILTALADARKQGGWGHFVVGVCMVLVAGISLWVMMTMSGQDPAGITQSIQIKK